MLLKVCFNVIIKFYTVNSTISTKKGKPYFCDNNMTKRVIFENLIKEIHQCSACSAFLPYPPRPILQVSTQARILIIGQAPGCKAHHANKPWQDNSGVRLRDWLSISAESFYNAALVAIVPMGFCFPGYQNKADAPPRKECAPLWHNRLLASFSPKLVFLVGRYAQQYYRPEFKTLTEAVQQTANSNDSTFVLPHPSGRNNIWLKRNPWFEQSVLPTVRSALNSTLRETKKVSNS